MMTDTPKLTDEQIRDMLGKATDGPWCEPEATTRQVTLSGGTIRKIRGDAHDNTPLAFVPGFERDEPEEGKANARLITAAPDLARLALERGAERDAALARAEAAEKMFETADKKLLATRAERHRVREAAVEAVAYRAQCAHGSVNLSRLSKVLSALAAALRAQEDAD